LLVNLATDAEFEACLTAPAEAALALQRRLPAGVLKVVARGVKADSEEMAA
jgi:hypothetical protein